jgi:nitrite reductase/ring-hydroxylating ferredoxin subunit
MVSTPDGFIHVGSLAGLEAAGRKVVMGRHVPLLVVHQGGQVRALDNRCPHLGFPLDRGSIEDGILTCHWHHARFDLASGCTFDLWADDVPTAEVRVEDGEVFIAAECRFADPVAHWRGRLGDGMAHNLGLVIAKSVLGARAAGVDDRTLLADAAGFGARMRDGFGVGMTIFTALGNLLPHLPEDTGYLALYQGIRRLAADCQGEAPRRERHPLGDTEADLGTLGRWFRRWIAVRHREGAERSLLSAIERGADLPTLAGMMLAAATDRPFADTSHAVDFVNKAFECVDLIGHEHAATVLPTVVGQLAMARGADEQNAWRHPIDLIPLWHRTFEAAGAAMAKGREAAVPFTGHAALAESLLVDDPEAVMTALLDALGRGAWPADLGQSLAYASALRIARFGTANEFSDWDTALHVFTYANAVHRLLMRIAPGTAGDEAPLGLRGVIDGALALHLTRYLNQPPARLPGERGDSLDDLPRDAEALLRQLLDAFDRQQQVSPAARLTARYLDLGHPPAPLIACLAEALLREDADFHTYQMVEAGMRQFSVWGPGPEGRTILIATARYLAAHCPTERARHQTARIARRLHRGGSVHEDEEDAPPAAAE